MRRVKPKAVFLWLSLTQLSCMDQVETILYLKYLSKDNERERERGAGSKQTAVNSLLLAYTLPLPLRTYKDDNDVPRNKI